MRRSSDMRKRGAVPKTHVTLSVEYQLWLDFQAACAAHKLTASSQFEDMMRKKLDRWQKEKKPQ